MPALTRSRFRISVVPLMLLFALFASACSGGVRPTLTGDRLVEPDAAAAAIEESQAEVPAGDSFGDDDSATDDQAEAAADGPAQVEQLVVEIIESFPHDRGAFTQGLELHDGIFFESTGIYGESELRRVVPATGEVTQSTSISAEYFAEGLTKVGNQLIQLTWKENTAFYWNADTFELEKEVAYEGEGWGLCHDGSRLVMTDGTPVLIFRDPTTFDEIGRVPVTLNGQDVWNLNEAECVNGQVWANIWQTELIVRIDPTTGEVNGVVDAMNLEAPAEPSGAVLNGIAWDASTSSFYVTGKYWPTMYRVNFVPAPAG